MVILHSEQSVSSFIFQVIHSGQKLRKKSAEAGEKRGWFSGFWGKKESKKKDEDSLIPESKFQDRQSSCTDEEKPCRLLHTPRRGTHDHMNTYDRLYTLIQQRNT